MSNFEITPLGESCVLIRLGDSISVDIHNRVASAARMIEEQPFAGFIECVPAYASVAVYYDPIRVWRSRTGLEKSHETILMTVVERLRQKLIRLNEGHAERSEPRTVHIPVCYGGAYGPDLEVVAVHCGMTANEVIELHSGGSYLVYMIGFAPGFPYLGGLSKQLAAPRRGTPRTVIPAGSVGIAGNQTGVYPLATPGGWQLIGRTPVSLFRPWHERPSLLQAGDRIKFVPIAPEQYETWRDSDKEQAASEWKGTGR